MFTFGKLRFDMYFKEKKINTYMCVHLPDVVDSFIEILITTSVTCFFLNYVLNNLCYLERFFGFNWVSKEITGNHLVGFGFGFGFTTVWDCF